MSASISCEVGSRGIFIGCMSSLLSLRTLHGSHAATMLVHDVSPPFERGLLLLWWASLESNQRQPVYERAALPLSYKPVIAV